MKGGEDHEPVKNGKTPEEQYRRLGFSLKSVRDLCMPDVLPGRCFCWRPIHRGSSPGYPGNAPRPFSPQRHDCLHGLSQTPPIHRLTGPIITRQSAHGLKYPFNHQFACLVVVYQ